MTVSLEVRLKTDRYENGEVAPPDRATRGAAAYDVRAARDYLIPPRWWPFKHTVLVDLGFRIGVPAGWCAKLFIRSGLARQGLRLANSVGIVDSDYRGKVKLMIASDRPWFFLINAGDRVGQMMIEPAHDISWLRYTSGYCIGTKRGEGGFGSTGR